MSAAIGNPPREYYLDIDTAIDLIMPPAKVVPRHPIHCTIYNQTLRYHESILCVNLRRKLVMCGYDQDGSSKRTQATDGVLGLSSSVTSLPSQWEKQGLVKNVIGICIDVGSGKGGYMFFGDDHVPTLPMTWVPLLHKPTM
ncbi:hypothetical protein SUGI_0423550 [Cryptomeria japonica]|nr:hypothetical protein SUGI_0423550 [Cryptomeria japonica]